MSRYFILLLLISSKAFAQAPIDKWKSFPIPSTDSVFSYNSSHFTWYVSLSKDGKVVVENKVATWLSPDTLPFATTTDLNPPYKKLGFRTIKKVDNGYLVGYYRGEWGGELYWYSEKGDSNYKITSACVRSIGEMDSKLFMVEGLAHLSSSSGSINQLEFKKNRLVIVRSIELPSAPEVSLLYGNKLFIVTSDEIVSFDGGKRIDILRKNGFWGILYPQSIVITNGILYSGMREGIYKFNLKTKREEWLMPE